MSLGHKHGHNRWLAWKLKKGLAVRGHVGGVKNPKGLVAGAIYKLFFKKRDPEQSAKGLTFEQHVGGTLGPTGRTNGD